MKQPLVVVAVVLAVIALVSSLFVPRPERATAQQLNLEFQLKGYLNSRHSPLSNEISYLLEQEHWKLLIAVSAIESQFCTKQVGFNCWGVTQLDGKYRRFESLREGIKETNDLIERWQNRGRWLTVNDMNCHYVQPCNPNWVKVVNKVLGELAIYE